MAGQGGVSSMHGRRRNCLDPLVSAPMPTSCRGVCLVAPAGTGTRNWTCANGDAEFKGCVCDLTGDATGERGA